MKKMICAALCAGVLLCGCAPSAVVSDPTTVTDPTEATVEVIELEPIEVTMPVLFTEPATEGDVEMGQTGCVRITYTNNVSNVRYVTKVEELPDYEALAKYDAAYFENKALLVILETTGSGSVQVGVASIADGTVTLSHEMSGDAGTNDMATWLLWAEVDQGLEGNWKVANPALANTAVSY